MVLFYDGFVFRSEGPGGPQPPQPAQQSKRLQQTQAQVDEVWNHASQIKLWDPRNFLGAWGEGGARIRNTGTYVSQNVSHSDVRQYFYAASAPFS